jgi:integrase/recombinase XerD
MTDSRQLPLFTLRPRAVADLSAQTPLKYAIPFFQTHLTKDGKTDYTVKSFSSDLGVLEEFAGGDRALGTFDTEALNEFLAWMEHDRGKPCSRKTYARRVTTLKVFFKWLHELKALDYDPAVLLLQRSGPAPLPVILAPEQVEAALAYTLTLRLREKPDTRPELLFRLLLDTGIKKGETAALELDHIERGENPVLSIKHKSARHIYKERRITLDRAWLALLDEYRTQYAIDALIFTCTPRNLEYVLADISDGAGLPTRISFEMLRWTCAVRDYLAGAEPDAIRDKLGLSDISWRETFAKIRRLAGEDVEGDDESDDGDSG